MTLAENLNEEQLLVLRRHAREVLIGQTCNQALDPRQVTDLQHDRKVRIRNLK
jgi:hypothetical protein